MRILLISTTIFPVPLEGYGGLEQICWHLALGLHEKGHQVTLVAPEGSNVPEGIELIVTGLRQPEEAAWHLYRERMESDEFDVIHDSSWEAWPYASSIGRDPELPIIHTIHTSPTIYGRPPEVQSPCFVGLSDQHCNDIRLHLRCDARKVYNGLDLEYYTQDPAIKRGGRWLWIARYTPEKGPLVAINLARKLNLQLDCFGDVEIVGDAQYVDRCRNACDGLTVRWNPGVTREETVNLYQSYKALLYPLQWSEPFGLCVCEANACGMPVMTLRRGAMPELVKNGRNGYVFDSEEELERALCENVVDNIKPGACRKVAEKFSLKRMVDSYEKLYQEVADGHRW